VVIEEEKDKETKSSIISLKTAARVLASPHFTADRLRLASNRDT